VALPVVPNTDTALMLGLAHTLVVEGLHDRAFLDRFCVGYSAFEDYLLARTDGTVPAEIEKKLQSLPLACVRQLPGLPSDLDRVVCSGHVMLINKNNRILDVFDFE